MPGDAHPVEMFRRRLAELTTYPPGVVPVPAFLGGTAFFAAAAGLVVTDDAGSLPPFPFGGVMFVGHNLDSERAFILWMRECDFVHFRLPENARQIPQSVFAYRQGRAYLQFGFELGTGVRTHVTSSIVYLVPVVVLLIPNRFVDAVVLALAYAVGRSLVPLVSAVGGARTRSAILTVVVSNSVRFRRSLGAMVLIAVLIDVGRP